MIQEGRDEAVKACHKSNASKGLVKEAEDWEKEPQTRWKNQR